MEKGINVEAVLAFLRGGENSIDLTQNPELVTRSILYLLQTKQKYHRRNVCQALITLLNHTPSVYRGMAWELIQQFPLSHLLEVFSILNTKVALNKENTKRLRHAVTVKLATTKFTQMVRSYFLGPNDFRSLFSKLILPRDTFKGKSIQNESYRLAYKLSTLSLPEVITEYQISIPNLVTRFHLPFEKVADMITSAKDAQAVADVLEGDTFYQHARWFRNILGDQPFETIAIQKMATIQNPMAFLSIQTHLKETNAITTQLLELMNAKADEAFQKTMKDHHLERLALLVDISGSMSTAVSITKMLYEAFSHLKITDLIAFNQTAYSISLPELREVTIGGATSVGAAIVLLAQRIKDRNDQDIPQGVILVTDLEENQPPSIATSLPLLKDVESPPFVIILCGSGVLGVGSSDTNLKFHNYPSAILTVHEFHKSLVMDITKEIVRLTAKVTVKEKAVTQVLKERRPISEEIGKIDLPTRRAESYTTGYLERLLCPNA